MSDGGADREEGVNFETIDPVLDDIDYPIEMAEFVAEYGDQTIERTNADPITIQEVFAGTGEDTFESKEEVRQSVLNLMPSDAVGREGYSDRGGSSPDATEVDEDESA
ncbi:DUF5789 family protein [Halorientalis halophila]|uniref:DUF5789 family protein n=1 Tax=Halorientalis halophila TaxID=3108499 RepID=UPI003009D7BF